MEFTLYVGNLAYTTTENELRTLFAQAGNVTTVDLITDRESGQSKGFAFVTLGTQTEAQKAIGMFHGFSLAHRRLKVHAAKTRAAQGGYHSRLSAFALADQKVNTHKPKAAPSGYQSRLSAFDNGNSPTGPGWRRGGSQR
jgi:RNA recognition motif-containing protein